MKRRNLIRGVASSGLLALGVAGAAGEVADVPDGGPTHVKLTRDDGSAEVVPIAEFLEGPYDVDPDLCCGCVCCDNCPCECGWCYGC